MHSTRVISMGTMLEKVILPTSFIGSKRYMVQNYQDVMAICRFYGPPDLFITFTCNPKWQAIADSLAFIPGQQPSARLDIVVKFSGSRFMNLFRC
jgi:hypothetical protein